MNCFRLVRSQTVNWMFTRLARATSQPRYQVIGDHARYVSLIASKTQQSHQANKSSVKMACSVDWAKHLDKNLGEHKESLWLENQSKIVDEL